MRNLGWGSPLLRGRLDRRFGFRLWLDLLHQHGRCGLGSLDRGFGFDFMSISTHDWLGPPLSAFLAKRNARLKRSKMG